MNTKLFLIEEHEAQMFDSSETEKWLELVEQLGLENQASLIKDNKSALPFPMMTEAENAIYSTLLDRQVGYKTYSREAIPLAVLSLIALSEAEKYFDTIEIWFSEKNPDPLVVGKRYTSEEARKEGYSWRMGAYKIAQWGAKFLPMGKLLPLYEAFKREELKVSHENAIRDFERELNKYRFQVEASKG